MKTVISIALISVMCIALGFTLGFIRDTYTNNNKAQVDLMAMQENIIETIQGARNDIQEIRDIIESRNQKVTVTAYHPPSRGINSDKDPNHTATMKKPISGWTAAISTELVELGWLDKKIYINHPNVGVRQATCRMETKVGGKRIDIVAPTLKWANKFGINKNILAVVLD